MRRFLLGCTIAGALAPFDFAQGRPLTARGNETLPADLQKIKITATGTLSPTYALLHLFAEQGYQGYALVDGTGRIVWHYRTKDYPFGADRRKNGNFVFMDAFEP